MCMSANNVPPGQLWNFSGQLPTYFAQSGSISRIKFVATGSKQSSQKDHTACACAIFAIIVKNRDGFRRMNAPGASIGPILPPSYMMYVLSDRAVSGATPDNNLGPVAVTGKIARIPTLLRATSLEYFLPKRLTPFNLICPRLFRRPPLFFPRMPSRRRSGRRDLPMAFSAAAVFLWHSSHVASRRSSVPPSA